MQTVDSIMEYLREQVEQRQILGPDVWLRGAQAINTLLQVEQDKLFEIEFALAKKKHEALSNGSNGVEARAIIEASEDYLTARKLKAKIDRANELIRISKAQARLDSEAKRNQ